MGGGLAFRFVGGLLLVGLLLGGLALIAFGTAEKAAKGFAPDPVTVAGASLESLRAQNRLIVFEAGYVATVTTTMRNAIGLSARQTLIMPGRVRYEVDMAALGADDVRWDAASSTLSVRLPAVEIAGPEVQLDRIQSYDGGGILAAFTDAEDRLDEVNRRRGIAELRKQAEGAVPMQLARDAAKRAVSSSFALPLRAAGMSAKVEAFFPGEERAGAASRWDLSRPISEVLADTRTAGAKGDE